MRFLVLLSLTLSVAGPAFGEPADDSAAGTTTLHEGHVDGEAQEGDNDEKEPKSEVAIVVVGTYESESEESFFTLGAEDEYRFIPKFGVSAAVEWVFESDGREVGFVLPVVYHVTGGLRLLAGPGFEHEDDTSFLFRVGVNYAFEFGDRYALIPALEFDFINGEDSVTEAVVYGVNFAVSF